MLREVQNKAQIFFFLSVPAAFFSSADFPEKEVFEDAPEPPPPAWDMAAAVAALQKLINFMHSYKEEQLLVNLESSSFFLASTEKEGGSSLGQPAQIYLIRQKGDLFNVFSYFL